MNVGLKRDPLPNDRKAVTRRFSLPQKHNKLAKEIHDGVSYLKTLAERELSKDETTIETKENLTAAINFMESVIAAPTDDRMKFYFTVGMYPDGSFGEIFIRADRSGSLASGAFDAVATMISIAVQYGVPLHVLLDKLRHSRFEPEGWTQDPHFPSASSPLDLLAQWLTTLFPAKDS